MILVTELCDTSHTQQSARAQLEHASLKILGGESGCGQGRFLPQNKTLKFDETFPMTADQSRLAARSKISGRPCAIVLTC